MVCSDERDGRRRMRDGQPGGADVPAVAVEVFAVLVRRSAEVSDLVADLLARPVRARLLGQDEIPAIRPPGLARLRTTGPVVHRHVRLDDSRPPHLPVAVIWALIVPWRLPEPVRAALRDGPEPLDRLLVRHAVRWSAEPVEGQVHRVEDGSTLYPWAEPAAPLVEQTRLVTVEGAGPVAATIDEVPFLRPRTDATTPLLPRHPG